MHRIRLPFTESYFLVTPQWGGLSPGLQWALLALVGLVPLGLMLWLYRYELRLVRRTTATVLLGLRLVALVLILGLVCLQPIYAFDHSHGLPGRVLIAVDRSGSMDVADPQRSPADKLRLARALKLAEGLCPDSQLADWLRDYEHKGAPQWLTAEEGREDADRQRELETERRRLHAEVLARVDKVTRSEAARRILGDEGVRLLSTLAAKHKIDVIGFNQQSWDVKPGQLEELFGKQPLAKGEDPTAFTDLRLPLVRALERAGPEQGKVLGVVLLTDGQHNAGEGPAGKAKELGDRQVPVYPVALGARKSPPDVAVISVRSPSAVFKDVEANVDVRFKIAGLPTQDFVVELRRPGEKEVVAERTVRHAGEDREYTESFPVTMDKVGTQTFVATVRPANASTRETRADNNSGSTSINVADNKIKVLIVDGEARWEYHYLASALQRDKTMQLERVVFNQPRLNEQQLPAGKLAEMGLPRQTLPEGPNSLSDFDCIILGDVEPGRLPLAERKRLEQYVADRGGTLVVLAGKRFMPLAYPETEPDGELDPLRKLLPVEAVRVAAPADGFPVTLTQAGKDAKFMELDSDPKESEKVWAGLPPHYWAVVGQAKPGATPLAYLPGGGEGKPLPEREKEQAMIARHNYGFGRVLFVGLDSTWRWRYKVGDEYHHRFWGQVIRQAASDKPLVTRNEYVSFGTPQPAYRKGQDQEVEVVVRFNDNVGPLKADLPAGARVLRLGDAKGKETAALVALEARPGQPRVLEGKVRDLVPGKYAVELAIPDLADKTRGPQGKPLRAEFTVLPPESREAVDLETRWDLLEEVAGKSGGKVFTAEDAPELVKLLAGQAIQHTDHFEHRLWQSWSMLALVVGLLTLEWAGRKLAGLP